MKTPLRLLIAMLLVAQSLPAYSASEIDGRIFDGSAAHQGGPNNQIGQRPHDNRPRSHELRSNLTAVPPIRGHAAKAQAKVPPHLSWGWDKTMTAAGTALAGAVVGFMMGGPIGAAVGFVGGMLIGAIAGYIMEEKKEKG
ncbi:MAG: hypothetical protein COB53_11230 [Elusimicrobia bacterium]|nr:MAG: hypothetical protein COB53_11230 [Elusimicrobiota bacterium]